MKFFTFASMIVLACVGLVASAPTAAVEERCATCEQACPSTHFWYSPGMYLQLHSVGWLTLSLPGACCLPHGGPSKVQNPPSGIACPTNWYYHHERSCCSPKLPTYNPKPTCGTSTYPNWNPSRQCCDKPSGPSGPKPSPKPVVYKPKDHYKWDRADAHGASYKNRLDTN